MSDVFESTVACSKSIPSQTVLKHATLSVKRGYATFISGCIHLCKVAKTCQPLGKAHVLIEILGVHDMFL
jgi:hypothetical protein